MPRHRPPTSGYARLSQADEEEEVGYTDSPEERDPYRAPRTISTSSTHYAPIQPQSHGHMQMPSDGSVGHRRPPSKHRRRMRSNSSGIDVKAINARLERWADEIASKFKSGRSKGRSRHEERLEIHHSVFQAPDGIRPVTAESLQTDAAEGQDGRMTKREFEDVVDSVKTAIELGVHPKMISQGSSGSYFARNAQGKVVGVFKPKDEEPYASRNPKWTKWIHRNLFPCFFGRACLIPNLSYVSEAAAYVLDTQLQTKLVPYTDIVHLSSKAFFYDFWQRSAFYRKRKPLPAKPGSFQVFLKGYKDANIFLRDNPWPDQTDTTFALEHTRQRKKHSWSRDCTTLGNHSDDEEDSGARHETRPDSSEESRTRQRYHWTQELQQSFREELEKLVVLDYIMRNTDRGLDNWMIKVDWESQAVSIVSDPPEFGTGTTQEAHPVPVNNTREMADPYRVQRAMQPSSRSTSPRVDSQNAIPAKGISIGAIDNSLSWPWKHPDAWRSFPFGWLFLPVSLIGQPFSQKTRDHFLPLLTSTDWWSETHRALRRIFEQDSDFKERMFARQMAVMKGQAWNVVETLKTPDHGPLELTRRTRVCVWDDLVDIPVAIPLRDPSAELRRQASNSSNQAIEEEMDISAVNGSSSSKSRNNGLVKAPSNQLPNPNRFELSRNPSTTDISQIFDGPESPATIHGEPFTHAIEAKDFADGGLGRPATNRASTNLSYSNHRRAGSSGEGRRRLSLTARYGNNSFLYDGDDAEGDLGYSAARDTENNTRRVVVERLEAVKSKNPVFTWC